MSHEGLRSKVSRFLARSVRTRTAVARHPEPILSFTFDDVHASAATTGADLLERHGARGTFYVAGSLIGTVVTERSAASREQCAALHHRGHEIGCHTYSHVHVGTQDRNERATDLARNGAVLDTLVEHVRIENFAYPYNATSLAAKRQLEQRFTTCRGGVPGINAGRVDLGFLRAVELQDDGIDVGLVRSWIEQAIRQAGWLIFFTHGVQDAAQPWRCTPGLLESAIVAARDAGCTVLTVAEAVRRLGLSAPAEQGR